MWVDRSIVASERDVPLRSASFVVDELTGANDDLMEQFLCHNSDLFAYLDCRVYAAKFQRLAGIARASADSQDCISTGSRRGIELARRRQRARSGRQCSTLVMSGQHPWLDIRSSARARRIPASDLLELRIGFMRTSARATEKPSDRHRAMDSRRRRGGVQQTRVR